MTTTAQPAGRAGPGLGPGGRDEILEFAGGASGRTMPRWLFLLAIGGAQVAFARAMDAVPMMGLGQALVIVAVGLFAVAQRNTKVVVALMAYLPAAEIAWRQASAPVPYLIAPYLLTLFAGLLIFTQYKHLTKPGRTAVLYGGLLIPSIIVTISTAGTEARQAVAFALSGPAALVALVVLFSQVSIRPWFYRRLLWVMLISGLAPLTIALSTLSEYIVNAGAVDFGTESNFVTSGGFGPVQVSSVLGLTVLAAVLCFLAESQVGPRVLCVVIGLLATVQSFLTFSRGGMFSTVLALAALALAQASNREARRRVLAVVAVVFAFGYYVVVPQIDTYTKGAFEERFSDTSSGRTTLAANDLQLFQDNIAFGVGPGMSRYRRISFELCELRNDNCRNEGSSHTEFTRLPGEHGLPGVVAVVLIGVLVVQAYRRAGPSRPITVAMLTWAVAQMFYANLRVAAVPMAFAFGFLLIRGSPEDDAPAPQPPPAPSLAP